MPARQITPAFSDYRFPDADNRQQAMVFRIDKNKVRSVLVSLEARTGLRVLYQDDEARKAGKG